LLHQVSIQRASICRKEELTLIAHGTLYGPRISVVMR
jgi:hypothetical protein